MEEGALVDAEEKALHREVMLENAKNMASLGGDVKIEGSSQAVATPFLTVKKEDAEKMSEKERLGGKEELKKYSSFQCADIGSFLHRIPNLWGLRVLQLSRGRVHAHPYSFNRGVSEHTWLCSISA
ncbi:zinc finger protein [Crotalus adamanteus]|uniref:Zinc finger protein n=1 Tax=Crotalus adamanteus TaxID=8729 RepID=A0AAW1BVJ4_CROAD